MKRAAIGLLRLLVSFALVIVSISLVVVAIAAGGKSVVAWGMAALVGTAGIIVWPRWPDAWRSDPPTNRQLAYARDLGIAVPRGVTKGQLSDMISAAKAR